MNNELLKSRFFTIEDERMEKVVYPLPSHWWSRFYEYAWASEFCKSDDVVLDAACGIPHPFKFYLAEYCKVVHAIDSDSRIVDYEALTKEIASVFNDSYPLLEKMNIVFRQSSITDLYFKKNMFDKIFCISALEHISYDEQIKALKEFNRTLKKDGMVILTLDYSKSDVYQSIDIASLEKIVKESGFKFAGEIDSSIPNNAINWDNILYCYRVVLVKEAIGE